MALNNSILNSISSLTPENIPEDRKRLLNQLTAYIQEKEDGSQPINLNFICTHNSRRSHLAQIWAQTLASYFNISNLNSYSGGTEATALFPSVIEALTTAGFEPKQTTEGENPVYEIKYAPDAEPIIGFSKRYDHEFNPNSDFLAVLTCTEADKGCPVVMGAEQRLALPYLDPKAYDSTPEQKTKYQEKSLEIATELLYAFSNIKNS